MRSQFTIILILSLLESGLAQGQDTQNDEILELTERGPNREGIAFKHLKDPNAGASSEDRRPVYEPVKVTLLSLDKTTYWMALGAADRVVCEVMIENITGKTISIPWSNELYTVEPGEKDPPDHFEAFLKLELKDESGQSVFLSGRIIYGSELIPGSLKSLGPGEKTRIRYSDRFIPTDGDFYSRIMPQLKHSPLKFDVRAWYRLNILPPADMRYRGIFCSVNHLAIELKSREVKVPEGEVPHLEDHMIWTIPLY